MNKLKGKCQFLRKLRQKRTSGRDIVARNLHGAMKGKARRLDELSGVRFPKRSPLGAAVLSDAAWAEVARVLKLTTRELEIIRGVFANLTEGAIASDLRISEHTVHTHLHRLFAKLRVNTRAQMVLRVMQELLFLTVSEAGNLPPMCRHHANGRCPMENSD